MKTKPPKFIRGRSGMIARIIRTRKKSPSGERLIRLEFLRNSNANGGDWYHRPFKGQPTWTMETLKAAKVKFFVRRPRK